MSPKQNETIKTKKEISIPCGFIDIGDGNESRIDRNNDIYIDSNYVGSNVIVNGNTCDNANNNTNNNNNYNGDSDKDNDDHKSNKNYVDDNN
eukprot:Awhi_evm1s9419